MSILLAFTLQKDSVVAFPWALFSHPFVESPGLGKRCFVLTQQCYLELVWPSVADILKLVSCGRIIGFFDSFVFVQLPCFHHLDYFCPVLCYSSVLFHLTLEMGEGDALWRHLS